jgi:hypothetical protein
MVFADLVGFTPLASSLSPAETVGLLDRLFSAFDALAERHGLEKIKTIGDAYMVVGGMTAGSEPQHTARVAALALDLADEQIAKLFDPIELISTNEFYYNSQTKIFTHKSRPLSPREFLQTIDDLHRKPTKLIRGIALRAKLIFFRVVLVKFFQVVSALFSGRLTRGDHT